VSLAARAWRGRAAFAELAPDWERLAAAAELDPLCNSHAWTRAYAAAYAADRDVLGWRFEEGGATALGLAVDRPEIVERLVLMGSAGLNAEITESLKPIVFYDYTVAGMQQLIKALTGERFMVSDELVRRRHELSIEPDTRRAYSATMGWIREQGGLFYAEDYIRRVRAPTLVVNGKNDLVVPLRNAYRFLELIPNSWGYFIPHCGHWAMLEAPADFIAATSTFLHAQVNA
jgi:2-hydroxy-6-oxo-6-(2'-aminophenyl)hexa-2,4-dienoate hydrolase